MKEIFPFLLAVPAVIILVLLLPTSQELIHWIILVGIRFSISKYDVDDGVSLDLP